MCIIWMVHSSRQFTCARKKCIAAIYSRSQLLNFVLAHANSCCSCSRISYSIHSFSYTFKYSILRRTNRQSLAQGCRASYRHSGEYGFRTTCGSVNRCSFAGFFYCCDSDVKHFRTLKFRYRLPLA